MQPNLLPQKSHGFSFIEMLIALAIFSIIILALNQTAFQSSQAITRNYFEEIALTLIHNAYEIAYAQNQQVRSEIPEAAEKLPEGAGEIFSSPEHINIEVSWSNRFSEQRNQLHVDI
jgi:prepilin-type N-terminal cleavage/methylation domain-containing protein